MSKEDVARLCSIALPGVSVRSITSLASDRHDVWRVGRVDGPPFVLKVFRCGPQMAQRELDVVRYVAELAPVPQLLSGLLVDEHLGVHYALSEWVDGTDFRSLLRASVSETPAVVTAFSQAAATLAMLHSVEPTGDVFLTAPEHAVIRRMVRYAEPGFHATLEESFVAVGRRFGRQLGERIRRVTDWSTVADSRENCDRCLVHGDFQPKNLVVADNGALRAVIDWELSHVGCKISDVAQILRCAHTDGLEDTFAKAYTMAGGQLSRGWRRRARLFDLAKVAVGLSGPDVGGDDVPLWVEFVEGCLEFLERGCPQRLRCASRQLP